MAKYEELVPYILRWEGGFVNDPDDSGGATNLGVTIATFRQYYGQDRTTEDLIKLTLEQWEHIFKTGYWDKCLGDAIKSQSVANILVDWAWMSGTKRVVKRVQKVLGVKADGIFGAKTLGALNAVNPSTMFLLIRSARIDYYKEIIGARPQNRKFLKGWMNRLNALRYEDR